MSESIPEEEFIQEVKKEIPNLDNYLSLLSLLTDDDFFRNIYNFTIGEYLKDRLYFEQRVETIANELEKLNKRTGITKAVSGGGSIASGGLALSGILLAPVTAGASLGLTAAGMGLGVASGVTGITSDIINDKKIKKANQEIVDMKETFKMREEILKELLDDFKVLADKMATIPRSKLDKLKTKYEGVIKTTYGGYTGYTGARILQTIQVLSGSGATSVGAAANLASPGIDGSMIFGRALITAGSTTAKVLSTSLAFVGIGVGTWDLVASLKRMDKNEQATKFREFLAEYRKQTEDIASFIGILKKARRDRDKAEEENLIQL